MVESINQRNQPHRVKEKTNMTMLTGTIAKQPIIKDKVIFSAIKTPTLDRPTQLVLFKEHRATKFIELLSNVNLGDVVTVVGKMQKNKLNNETEISVEEIYLGTERPNAIERGSKWSINHETDFIEGNQTEFGTISIIPAKKNDTSVYYTDGEMIWAPHWKEKMPAAF